MAEYLSNIEIRIKECKGSLKDFNRISYVITMVLLTNLVVTSEPYFYITQMKVLILEYMVLRL